MTTDLNCRDKTKQKSTVMTTELFGKQKAANYG